MAATTANIITETAADEAIAEMLTTAGYESIIEVDTKATNGYRVVTADRDEAFSVARKITNAFDGDPEAGFPTIAVQPEARGFAVCVIIRHF